MHGQKAAVGAAVDTQSVGTDAGLLGVSEDVVDRLLAIQHVERANAAGKGLDGVLAEAGAAAVVDEQDEEAEAAKCSWREHELSSDHPVRTAVGNDD